MAKEGGPPSFRGVFIRAPGILEVGPDVQVLAEVPLPSNKPAKNDAASESLEVNPLTVCTYCPNYTLVALDTQLILTTFTQRYNRLKQELRTRLLLL